MTEIGNGGTLRVLTVDSRAGRKRLERLDRRGRGGIAAEIRHAAARIVERVRADGDGPLLDAVRRFDGFEARSVGELLFGGSRAGSTSETAVIKLQVIDLKVAEAIERSRAAIEAYHRSRPLGPGVTRLEREGVSIEERRLPIRRVGIYVPGGRFPYPSTVLMTALPARLAGVEELVVATPPRAYVESPVLRHVLDLVGADEVWGMGGAHAVAALAYGTESIRAVDLIAGPGNAWVAAAKQHVAGDVGVDRDAGPSEVVIVAADGAPASWVAADLLAQAEHDPLAVAVLVTDSRALAERTASEVDRQLSLLPTRDTAAAALEAHGAAFVTVNLDAALALAERLAPEHLQLIGAAAEGRAPEVRNAGAVFVGAPSPVVFGDYVAGPSHVLPTGGSARFASGLGIEDFVRRSHTVRFSRAASRAWAGAAETLATAEGLAAHAAAAGLRRGARGESSTASSAPRQASSGTWSSRSTARASPPGSRDMSSSTASASAGGAGAFVRPEFRALSAYSLHRVRCRYRLDQNEAPWDLPRALKREALARLAERNWAHYPDFHAEGLRRLLGERNGWPPEGVLVGNGSGELLATVLEGVVRPGQEVLACEPCFGLYESFVRRAAGVPRFLEPAPDLELQIGELRTEIERDPTRPVILCTPNNPTGTAAEPATVDALLTALEAPLLLDNAYGEFCRHDYRPLLRRHSNLLVFRTLSKAWSLGGIRLGYLLADPELAAELIKVKLPYNIGHASQVIGEVALEHADRLLPRIAVVRARREQWAAMLREFGFEVFDSEANFLLARHPGCSAIREGLAAGGVLVRDVSRYPGLANCMRIGVGGGPALRAARRALAGMGTVAGMGGKR